MAEQTRRRRPYQTYGNLAYQTRYDGNTVRAPRPREVEHPRPQPRPRVQPRRRVQERPRVEVRQPGAVVPSVIVGFLSVALCAALLVMSYARLAVVNDETIQLREQLDELKSAEAVLLAQYELCYDLAAIEAQLTADGSMIKLQPDQVTYLDTSEPDSIMVYDSSPEGLDGLLDRALEVLTGLVS